MFELLTRYRADGRTSEITTPWVTYPDLIDAECVNDGTFSYLEITVKGDPGDPRTDDIGGDLVLGGEVLRDWGLHLVDFNLVIGDLVDLVATQAEPYTGEG